MKMNIRSSLSTSHCPTNFSRIQESRAKLCMRSSQCFLHAVKDPAGSPAFPGCATRHSLSLSPHILQISRKPSIPQCTDCGLMRWHRAVPSLCSAVTALAKPSGRISRPVNFPHSSGTLSIQINAAKVECYSRFSPLPSRAGVPWTTEKDSVQWSSARKRQISL